MAGVLADADLESLLSTVSITDVSSSSTVTLSEAEKEQNEQEQLYEVEALQSIYAEDFRIIERPKDSLRSFSIAVPIELEDALQVTVKLHGSSSSSSSSSSSTPSASSSSFSASSSSSSPFSLSPPVTKASDASSSSPSEPSPSVHSNHTPSFSHSFSVSHLPPMHLLCVLPPEYPSHTPPLFHLSSPYLNPLHLSKLCKELDSLWNEQGIGEEGGGQVIIYSWVDWLSRKCLTYLGFSSVLELGPYDTNSSLENGYQDSRAISRKRSLEEDVGFLMRWDNSEKDERFRHDIHSCFICFSEFPGTDFFRLSCNHFFCQSCLKTFTKGHVAEGSVAKIVCPDTTCKTPLHPGLVRELLSPQEFLKWEEFTLQKSLAAMADVSFCPRCSEACVEEEDNCAQCSRCYFVFCGLCREAWHVGRPCMDSETRLRVLEERAKGNFGDAERKQMLNLLNEVKSTQYLKKETKQCPSCKMAISKTEGCNKMTCSNCQSYFCYRCGKPVEGYDHFQNGQCVLFDAQEIARYDELMNNQRREMGEEGLLAQAAAQMWPERRRLCPLCRQPNIKEGNNNHMLCWACGNHFCGLCAKVVRSSAEHYGPMKCKQHTR